MKIMSYDIFTDPLLTIKITDTKQIINTINAHSYIIAQRDTIFKKSLQKSDVLIPDGSGIVLAAKILKGKQILKIAGADLHEHMLRLLNEHNGRCFYMGASQATLDKIKERLTQEHPRITAGFYSPPYKPEFSAEDNIAILDAINAFKPDVLFVGMTAPKQEKWAHGNKEKIDTKAICPIGAVFDFYVGNTRRPHKVFLKLHIEWLGRLLQEPRRLWKRNLSIPLFLIELVLFKIGVKK